MKKWQSTAFRTLAVVLGGGLVENNDFLWTKNIFKYTLFKSICNGQVETSLYNGFVSYGRYVQLISIDYKLYFEDVSVRRYSRHHKIYVQNDIVISTKFTINANCIINAKRSNLPQRPNVGRHTFFVFFLQENFSSRVPAKYRIPVENETYEKPNTP